MSRQPVPALPDAGLQSPAAPRAAPGDFVQGGNPPGPPDWGSLEGNYPCPLCEYDLRGLTHPRCPECGYPFAWPDVLDPHRRRHPYLFEHHRGRGFWSYWRTFRGAMRPKQFWSELHPVQPSDRARLIAYWLIGAVTFLIALVLQRVLVFVATMSALLAARGAGGAVFRRGRLADWDDVVIDVFMWGLLPLLWMPATAMTLMIFWISMRRARIRKTHVLRCVIYSGDPMFWAEFVLLAFIPAALGMLLSPSLLSLGILFYPLLVIAALMLSLARLVTAYRLYLHFDRPFLTVLASQIIVALLAANLAFLLFPWDVAMLLRSLGLIS